MSAQGMWVDNPLFVKHVRSRLRKGQFLAPAVVVGAICLLVAYSGYLRNWTTSGWTFDVFVTIQAVVLGLMGAAQVSSAVGGARESGILDFHRVSPLSPLAVTLGFFFGAPVREYVLAGMTLPFVLYCAAEDAPGFLNVLQVEVAVLLLCWLVHALALLTSLASKKPKGGTKGAIGVVVFVIIVVWTAASSWGPRGISPVVGNSPTMDFFTAPLPWLAFMLLYGVPFLFFLMLASVRKMRSDRAHVYTKPEAVAALGTWAILVLGGVWGVHDFPQLPLFVIYTTAGLALVLILTITPNLGEFTKGFRRAEREGKGHIGYWDDLAPNRLAVFTICAIVLVAPTVVWYFVAPGPFDPQWTPPPGFGPPPVVAQPSPSWSVPIAVAVLSVATFGLALQFFTLRFPRRGTTLLGLFVFGAWILPPVIGTIFGVTQASGQFALAVMATSPIAGIAMSTNLGPMSPTGTDLLKLSALLPALTFALLFNNAVTHARRRAVAEIHGGPGPAKPEAEPDPLVA
jgi:hypothetical protein